MSSNHRWPDRQTWRDKAEDDVRHACYPQQRVSDQLVQWTTAEQRERIAHVARRARLEMGRLIRVIEKTDAWPTVDDVGRQLSAVHVLLRLWSSVETEIMEAADAATDAAVAREIERRRTDEAWQKELHRRARIDEDWS